MGESVSEVDCNRNVSRNYLKVRALFSFHCPNALDRLCLILIWQQIHDFMNMIKKSLDQLMNNTKQGQKNEANYRFNMG